MPDTDADCPREERFDERVALVGARFYAHLLADDHSDAMAALGAMESARDYGGNVVPLWG